VPVREAAPSRSRTRRTQDTGPVRCRAFSVGGRRREDPASGVPVPGAVVAQSFSCDGPRRSSGSRPRATSTPRRRSFVTARSWRAPRKSPPGGRTAETAPYVDCPPSTNGIPVTLVTRAQPIRCEPPQPLVCEQPPRPRGGCSVSGSLGSGASVSPRPDAWPPPPWRRADPSGGDMLDTSERSFIIRSW
jgi:hypothetical protein